jgi:flagellar basal body P-ring formation protein FlgA
MLLVVLMALLTEMTGIPVEGERIRKAVEEYVYASSGATRQEMLVELRGRMPRLTASSSEYSIRIGLESAPKFKGYVSFPIEIISHGKTEAKAAIATRIRTFGTVLVTSRLLQQHQALANEDVSLCRMETTNMPDDWVSDLRWITGKRTVRMISENTVLGRTMAEAIPIVKQGDPVTIVVVLRNAVVKVQGNARQDGCIGDMISVQRAGSHERFHGKIISEHAVEIRLDDRSSFSQKN